MGRNLRYMLVLLRRTATHLHALVLFGNYESPSGIGAAPSRSWKPAHRAFAPLARINEAGSVFAIMHLCMAKASALELA